MLEALNELPNEEVMSQHWVELNQLKQDVLNDAKDIEALLQENIKLGTKWYCGWSCIKEKARKAKEYAAKKAR